MKNFENIKLIATDLDGTLLGSNSEASDNSVNVLNTLHFNGYKLAIITGRPLKAIPSSLKNVPFDYIAGSNGQILADNKTKKIYQDNFLYYEDIKKLAELSNHFSSIMNLSQPNVFYLVASTKNLLFSFSTDVYNRLKFLFERRKKNKVKFITNINHINVEKAEKIAFISKHKNLLNLKNEINNKYGDKYSAFLVNKHWLEVQDVNVSKGNALKKICELENIDIKDTLVFGDAENDISMVEVAGISVAMLNGFDTVKQKAKYISTRTNAEDGVAEFLKDNLIK